MLRNSGFCYIAGSTKQAPPAFALTGIRFCVGVLDGARSTGQGGDVGADMRVSQTGRLLLAGGTEMVRNVDWYTNWLYDFRDFLDNRQSVFPHCSLLLEANRHPDILDDSVPLKDVRGETVYRKQMEPDDELRKTLSQKYLTAFHASIKDSGLKQDSTGPSGR